MDGSLPASISAEERRALVRKMLGARGVAPQRGARPAHQDEIPRQDPGTPTVLSLPQQRLWFLEQLQPGASTYNLCAALALSGQLDVQALERALGTIVARHDALRMSYPVVEGEARADVAAQLPLVLPLDDISSVPAADRDASLRALLGAEAHATFDLTRAPLFRLRLIRLAPDEHVLALTAHHIIFDGWSIGIFVRELGAAYPAARNRSTASMPQLPIGYADFAAWQRARMERGTLEPDLAYWTRQLAELSPLELPSDRPRPAVPTLRGSSLTFSLSRELTTKVEALARDHGATLFMALTAGLFGLLGRYTGQSDVAVGSPVAGRSEPALEGLIGLFANTLVLRGDLTGEPSFVDLLARVRAMTIDAYAHQDAPFEAIVERLQPERRFAQQPLFRVAFALQHEGMGALSLPGLDVRVLDVPSASSKFDLTMALTTERGGVRGSAEFSTDLFDTASIERFTGHYVALLSAAVREPDVRLDRLPILSAGERRSILDSWAGGGNVTAGGGLLHESFELQAVSTPLAIALRCADDELTYGALNARANQLARYLRRSGVRVEDRVGLCLDRSLETVVAILAVLKAGAAYVPVDPVNPPDRVQLIVEDAGARLVLVNGAHADRLSTLGAEIVSLESIAADVARESAADLDLPGAPGQLAYIIYTSGSTGRPKGTLIQHDHVQRLFAATDRWFRFGPTDVWTLFHSYGFDFSVWELWGALRYGGRLVVVPYLVSRSPSEFYDLLVGEQVTVLNQTPSAFRQLIEAEGRLACPAPLALRLVVFGGEALEIETLRPWFDRHGDDRPVLANMYGITETTVHVTYRPITIHDLDTRPGSVIGQPIPDLRVVVLDQNFELVPPGVVGELFVGGAGVARGYLGLPDLTAARFIPDPFDSQGGRLYRSGDLARFKPTGDLEYLGRIDHQVKVRGFRIELGEIEHALASHPDVADALVLPTAQQDGRDRRLVAYVILANGTPTTIGGLRAHLQARLPDYMIPSAFVILDRMPLTPHGKVDRHALPPPADESRARRAASTPPSTPVELTLAAVWSEVLGVAQVGVDDNFFELGGDSILSIKVLANARQRGVQMTLQQLFQHQTIAAIAAALPQSAPAGTAPEELAPFALVSAADREAIAARFGATTLDDAYPLTRLQSGMLFQAAFSEDATVYHNISSFHLRIAFDREAFEHSLAGLVGRHPVLRTSLHPSGFSEPLQVVHRSVRVTVSEDDLRHLSDAGQDRAIDAWMEDERHRRFDWETAPLFRVHVHRRRADAIQITLTEHHAILDGWSVATMLSELMSTYLAGSGKGAPGAPLPPRALFAEQIHQERRALASEETSRFWSEWTREIVAPPLPRLAGADRPAGVIIRDVTLLPALVDALDGIARDLRVPFRTVLLAAHVYVVGCLSAQSDVATGLVVNTRPESVDGDRALGLFLNTVPLRLTLDGGRWRELIDAVFAAERAVLPWRTYPMAELLRSRGGSPLFNTAFNYVHFHVYDTLANVAGLEVVGQTGFAETDFPLAASFSRDVVTGGVRLSLECADAGLDGPALERIATYYDAALEAIARNADSGYRGWSPLSTAERAELARWSRGRREPPQPALVHERIAAHAHMSPRAAAVLIDGIVLDYGQLEVNATRMASALRARGIGAESCVGLLADASPHLVTVMLAVWKAGGAFVPLDPAYPTDRLLHMIGHAAPAIVVASCAQLNRVADAGAPVVCLEDLIRETPADSSTDCPLTDPDALAYVIYTSGSTGMPKGVMATHRGLRNLVDGQIPRFGLTPASRVLQYAALGFDAAISEICTTLAAGAALVLARRADLRVPDRVVELLRTHTITTVTLPPTMLAVIGETDLPQLTTIVSAGEACRPDLVRRWGAGRRVLNAYGPTETTVCATMTEELIDGARVPPIGRPLENLDVWVLDRFLSPVPVGVVGELYVSGASLARGYQGQPDLTAERFIPQPFSEVRGERMYRTGDAVRWAGDGQIEFVGRLDTQVKVRGVRVELGEIEAVLQGHPDVRHAAVLLRADEGSTPRLVAYVEGSQGRPSVDEIRRHLEERLPDAAVPAAIVVLDRLPLTSSGKIDRRALPAPAAGRPALGEAFVGPRTPTETVLARIWAGVLRVDRVGVHDNFFRLGGDSILSLQVVSRARSVGIRITPQQVFEHGTVAALAAIAGATDADRPEGPVAGGVGLTPIQRWFFELDVPARQHWNQALLLETPADVDIPLLARAFRAVVAHHDVFRLRFTRRSAGWEQRYGDPADDAPFDTIDMSEVPPWERPARLATHASVVQRSLDLAAGPLVTGAHYGYGGDRGRLLIVAHHLVIDGVSWRILLDDLQLACAQAQDRGVITLPPSSASFQAWSRALELLAASPAVRRDTAYWSALDAHHDVALPGVAVAGGSANRERDAETIETWLDGGLTHDLLRVVPDAYHTETEEVLATAAARALASWTGRRQVRLVLESHGREMPGCDLDLSRSVGWFTATYPVVLDLAGAETPGEALKAVKEQLRAVPSAGMSYGLVRYPGHTGDEVAAAGAAGGAISFNYLGQLDAALTGASAFGGGGGFAAASEPTGAVRDPEATRPHLIDIVASIEGGRVRVTWVYPGALLRRAEAQRVADDCMSGLADLIAHCRDPKAGGFTPSDFPEMDFLPGELDALIEELDDGRGSG